ncbi:hypothetical protein WDU94_004885 [Cyamophila willieti]
MYPSSQIQRSRNAVALRRGFRRAASMYVGVGTAFAYIPPIPEMTDEEEEHEKGFKANITMGQVIKEDVKEEEQIKTYFSWSQVNKIQ